MYDDVINFAQSICEEFCETTLIDPYNGSILMYIPKRYYAAISTRLVKLSFLEVFKFKKDKQIVCLFQFLPDSYVYDEDDEYDEDDVDF